MSNIWADTFSAIREPHLSEEKKEKEEKGEKKHKEGSAEEKAEKNGEKEDGNPKRWWDDDGDGKGYEKGEVEGKFPKKKVNKEEVEKLDEISSEVRARTSHSRMQNLDAAQNREMGARDAGASAEEQSKRAAETSAAAAKVTRNRRLSSAHARSRARMNTKEERELNSRTDSNDKIDVRKGIRNKVNTKPTVSEELEAWIGELLEEGYDLSSFTLEEVSAIYESVQLDEADTYGMPPRGDAERQKADPMSAAKAKAARAKVAKEKADLQVAQQTQKMKVSAESVLSYVAGRTPLFEGVFDPKKSKLKPAAERTKNAMTDAERAAKKREEKRTAEIHSKGEIVLQGLRPQGKKGKVKTTPDAKPAAPAANRTVKGKYDKLGKAADAVLRNLKDK